MYPIEEFFDSIWKHRKTCFQADGYSPKRIDEIIQARYRDKGYEVYWLLFSAEHIMEEPNISRIKSDIFTVYPNDNVISAGVSFSLHVNCKVYPDAEYILSQLPDDIESLAIGGFHLDDCVDFLASVAHKKQINVKVDEDVTDFFFAITILCGLIPLIREKYPTLDEMEVYPHKREMIIRYRKKRPWLPKLV